MVHTTERTISPHLSYIVIFFLNIAGVIGICRTIHQLTYPHILWLSQPVLLWPCAFIVGICITKVLLAIWPSICRITIIFCMMPLSFNLWHDAPPVLILFLSLWFVILIILHHRPHTPLRYWLLLLCVLLLPLFIMTVQRNFGTADTFEFQVTAPKLGIAHPTGYPLYLMLGKLWTYLPIGTIAARLNSGTMVYTLLTAAIIQYTIYRHFAHPAIATVTAATFATLPTVWGQSIAAEVYTLHALIVAAILYTLFSGLQSSTTTLPHLIGRLAFLIGLGLTNHLTTILLGATCLTFALLVFPSIKQTYNGPRPFLTALASFCLPLLLYLYLPLRWRAVNDDHMGIGRFIEWVTGSRFSGALQWNSFIEQPDRYAVVGRLFLYEWGMGGLSIILITVITLAIWRWKHALLLMVTTLVFAFYALNYHVPDLAVFIIPAHLSLSLFWGCATSSHSNKFPQKQIKNIVILLILSLFLFLSIIRTWHTLPTATTNELRRWGDAVLALDLAPNSIILADSDKFPPLYYLQQAEQKRPDVTISLLPDEAAYRAEVDQQLTAGRTVYLARYLPRLPYRLTAVGPLTEVDPMPQSTTTSSSLTTIHHIDLITADIEPISPFDHSQTAVTIEWLTKQAIPTNWLVYLRWHSEDMNFLSTIGQHPVNNLYPTSAWQTGHIITDFYQIPRPILPMDASLKLQIALAPAFTLAEKLAWHTIGSAQFPAFQSAQTTTSFEQGIFMGDHTITGITVPQTVRPNSIVPVTITGRSSKRSMIQLTLDSSTDHFQPTEHAFAFETSFIAPLTNGTYDLLVSQHNQPSRCHQLFGRYPTCTVAQIMVSGISLPDTAINYADQFALLSTDIAQPIIPRTAVDITLHWQALATTTTDYTVFVQLLDEADTIISQIDSSPLQGTFPTSQWKRGEKIKDLYQLPIPEDLPAGNYHLYIGFYNLRDLRRLPVLDIAGNPIDDKYQQSVQQ